MDIIWTVILILIGILMYVTWNTAYRRCNLPPGPSALPFIGTLLHIKRGKLVISLMKLWNQYGPVYTLYFGSRPVVVLCGYDAVKEALVDMGEEFGGRGRVPVLEKFTQGYGLALSNDKRWKIMRTFTMKTLKSYGFGKKSNEWKIQKEAQCVVEEFRECNGHPVDPAKNLMEACTNIFFSILFGDRLEYKNERFIKLL